MMRTEVHGDSSPSGQRSLFEAALQRQCLELDISLDLTSAQQSASARDPAVAVVFPRAGAVWTAAEANDFPHFANAAYPVIPVVADATAAGLLPASLSRFNAFQTGIWHAAWPVGLVDEVLSHGWQRRRERRVFISYKRSDSGPVAQQLYDALTARGYHTFLDDVSIGKGDDFQRELMWWLNDADILLVLITPGFENSKWCLAEITRAQGSNIGLLGVEWPASVFGNPPARTFPQPLPPQPGTTAPPPVADSIDADQRISLVEQDFDGAVNAPLCELGLTSVGLDKVLAHCARQRALAIRLRLESLIPLAQRVLKPNGALQATGVPGDFTFSDVTGGAHFVRLLPFRPDARAIHDAFQSADPARSVGCVYEECDVNDARAEAMRWLADGSRESESQVRRTRIWACTGDKVMP